MNISIKTILLFLFSFVFSQANGQLTNKIDDLIAKYPIRFNSYEELADKIETDFTTDEDKARAGFAWIAMNIKYQTKRVNKLQKIRFSYSSEKDLQAQKDKFRRELAKKTMKSKKALCEGYATLYQEICSLMNIECVIIPGTAKRFVSEIGKTNLSSNHAWNAIKTHGRWKLVDVTWAAGSVDYAKMQFLKEYTPAYFNSDPKEFAMKHYPDNRDWLLLNSNFTKEEFALQAAVFNDFIGNKYRIISPENGFLSIQKGKEIKFAFQNIPESIQIAYHFKSEKFGQLVKPIKRKGQISFSIPTNSSGNDELIIYFDNEAVLGYKVGVK